MYNYFSVVGLDVRTKVFPSQVQVLHINSSRPGKNKVFVLSYYSLQFLNSDKDCKISILNNRHMHTARYILDSNNKNSINNIITGKTMHSRLLTLADQWR